MRTSFRLPAALLAAGLAAACSRPVVVETPAPAPTTPAPAPAQPKPAPIAPTGEAVVRAMYDRYAGKWYRNLTFVQQSTYYTPTGAVSRRETWYEAGAVPGRLRIDIGAPSLGNGTIYANDSVYVFQGGRLVLARPGHNELMVLGFDVYGQPVERTVALLRELGFDLSLARTDTFAGRPHYVVGARAGDLRTKQFWVDAERLLFTRLLQPARASRAAPADSNKTQEIRFQKYVPHGGGWVAEEVDFLRDGQRFFFEAYENVRVNQELDPALWDPHRFTTARHWWTGE